MNVGDSLNMSSFVIVGQPLKEGTSTPKGTSAEKLKGIVSNTEKLLQESHLQLSAIAQQTLSKSGIQVNAEAQIKLGDSWVITANPAKEEKPANSLSEQWGRINNGIEWLQQSVPQVVTTGAKMYTGVYTLAGALAGLATGGGILPAIVGVAAGIFTFIDATKGTNKPPGEVEKLLGNAQALVSMVKQQEEANLRDLNEIDKKLTTLEDAHQQIETGAKQIRTSLTGATDEVLKLKEQADTALTEAKDKISASEESFKEAKSLFTEGKTHLEESSKCIQEIMEALNTPVDLTDKEQFQKLMGIIRTLAERAQNLSDLGMKEMDQAKAKLDEGHRQSNEGTTQLCKGNTLLGVAVDLHSRATKEAVEKLKGLEGVVETAQVATQEIKTNVDDIKNRVKTNLTALGETKNTLLKVSAAWDRFITWGAAALGMLAAVAVVAATLALAGTGVGAIAIGVVGGLAIGAAVTIGVKNLPSIRQDIANKINKALFGEVNKLQGDALPAENKAKVQLDNLSSSFWGKVMKRESKTVGTAYVNLGNEQKEYRFDLRNKYPIDPKDLEEIIGKAKLEMERDPNNFNFEEFEAGFNLEVGEEKHNLLGDLGTSLIKDLKKEQKKLKEIKNKELELNKLQEDKKVAQEKVEKMSPQQKK